MCYSTWCMFITIVWLVALFFLTSDEKTIGCNNDSNEWTYSDCTMAVVLDAIMKLVILNSALLPRVVFVKTE